MDDTPHPGPAAPPPRGGPTPGGPRPGGFPPGPQQAHGPRPQTPQPGPYRQPPPPARPPAGPPPPPTPVRPPTPHHLQPTKPQVPATHDVDQHDYESPYDYPPPEDYDHEPPMRRESRPHPPVDPIDYQRERDRHSDRLNALSNTIYVLTALIALTFVLHIVFVLTGANGHSGIVSFTYFVARVFVLGFGDVFTPSDAKIGLVLNYGLAAIIYVLVGRVVARALRRR